jgi:hypothetical protein
VQGRGRRSESKPKPAIAEEVSTDIEPKPVKMTLENVTSAFSSL